MVGLGMRLEVGVSELWPRRPRNTRRLCRRWSQAWTKQPLADQKFLASWWATWIVPSYGITIFSNMWELSRKMEFKIQHSIRCMVTSHLESWPHSLFTAQRTLLYHLLLEVLIHCC